MNPQQFPNAYAGMFNRPQTQAPGFHATLQPPTGVPVGPAQGVQPNPIQAPIGPVGTPVPYQPGQGVGMPYQNPGQGQYPPMQPNSIAALMQRGYPAMQA